MPHAAISTRCSITIQTAMTTNNLVLNQNRGDGIRNRRSRRSAYVSPAAWIVTHTAIREQATSSRVTIGRAWAPGSRARTAEVVSRHGARSVGSEALRRAAVSAQVIHGMRRTPSLRSLVEIPEAGSARGDENGRAR